MGVLMAEEYINRYLSVMRCCIYLSIIGFSFETVSGLIAEKPKQAIKRSGSIAMLIIIAIFSLLTTLILAISSSKDDLLRKSLINLALSGGIGGIAKILECIAVDKTDEVVKKTEEIVKPETKVFSLLPARVIDIKQKNGSIVAKDDIAVVLETQGLIHKVAVPEAGIIHYLVKMGDQVTTEDALFIIKGSD